MTFQKSHIINNNRHLLHLYNVTLKFEEVNINYEEFILMLDAPNLRKLDIKTRKDKSLSSNDLLFISGLYNLESINIDAMIDSMDQIKKLERLREIKGILLNDQHEKEKTKQIRKKYYNIKKEKGASEKSLDNYLMFQSVIRYNDYLDLLDKLYVKRLDRVNWESKIIMNNMKQIKKELMQISEMSHEERKNISKEIKEVTLEDQLDGLYFDKNPIEDEEEYIVNSRPFGNDGIDYYVKRKKIILD